MIVALTPTGSRPAQFDLCQRWMSRQTYAGKVVWIIVDDCYPVTTNQVGEDFRENWTIIKVYPKPVWHGENTQARNIRAGINTMTANYSASEIEAIFIIEDDDYYRPVYLEKMMSRFSNYDLIGERNTIYYNVQYRRYVTNPNTIHASLFQTAFRYSVIPVFNDCLPNKFIDCVFWARIPNRHLFYDHDLAVGIKGIPGRGGIGAGHSMAMNMRDDSTLHYLQTLIGQEDAKLYEGYYRRYGVSQRDILTKKRL